MMRLIVLLVIALQAIMVLASVDIQEISVSELNQEYDQNEIRADSKYKGKTIVVYGEVSEIQSGPIIIFSPAIKHWLIRCDLRKSEAGKVAKLNRDSIAGIQGRCRGRMGDIIYIDEGVMLDTWKEKERQRQAEERENALTKVRSATSSNTPAVSAALSDDILNVPQDDPAAVVKAMIAKNPNDREARAELGHMMFLKAKSDATLTKEATTHLDKAVGDTLETKVDIDNWEGQARFELAYIYFSQKKMDEARSLINSIQDYSHNDTVSDTVSTFRLLAGRLAENARDDVQACKYYESYLVPKMKKGNMTPLDLNLYVHAWSIVIKHSRPDDPKYISMTYFCKGTWPSLEDSVLAVEDAATIRQVVELMRKVEEYYPEKILKKLNARRR